MNRFALAFIAISAIGLTPQASQAATSTISFLGFLDTGASDQYNTFGLGTNLSGSKIKLSFNVDDVDGSSTSTPSYSYINGTSNSSFSVTINNITKTFSAASYSSFTNDASDASGTYDQLASGSNLSKFITVPTLGPIPVLVFDASANLYSYANNILNDASLGKSFTYTATGTEDFNLGQFGLYNVPALSGVAGALAAGGTFRITQVSVGAVPESSTWLMMIIGFGAIGASLRRRRARSDGNVQAFA